jgi:hypothetical protein
MSRTHREQTAEEKALGLADNEFLDPNGYIRVRDHTRVGGSVLKHRLVMEREIGRPLRKDEQVRFKGKDKHDVTVGNLRLVTTDGNRGDILKKIQAKERKIQELQDEITDLRNWLKEMPARDQLINLTAREMQVARGEIPDPTLNTDSANRETLS